MEEQATSIAIPASEGDSGLDTTLNTDRSTSSQFTDSTIYDPNDFAEFQGGIGELNNNANITPKIIINDGSPLEHHDDGYHFNTSNDFENYGQEMNVDEYPGDSFGSRIEPDGGILDQSGNPNNLTDGSNVATDGSGAEENTDVSFDARMKDFMTKVDQKKADETNWVAVLKAMDYHYQNQLSLQTEQHIQSMHELKLKMENELTLRQCEIQERLASHCNVLNDDTHPSKCSVTSQDSDDLYQTPGPGGDSTSYDKGYTYQGQTGHYTDLHRDEYAGYKDEGYQGVYKVRHEVVHMPEIGVYHVQQPVLATGRYELNTTPINKALNFKKKAPLRTQDSGFTDDMSTGMKMKSRSVFAGEKPSFSYDVISPSRLFPSPDMGSSGQDDSSADFIDLPMLKVSAIPGPNMATSQNPAETPENPDSHGGRTPKGDGERRSDDDVMVDGDDVSNKENVAASKRLDSEDIVADGSLLHPNENATSPSDGSETASYRMRINDKYTRHLADMKSYYEGEIRALREELIRTRDQHLTALRQSRDYEVSATDVSHQALRSRCELLEEQNKNLGARVDQLENTLVESQRECNKKQRQISRLDCEMDNAERRVTMYMEDAQKLMEEHEKLRKDHRGTQSTLTSVENQLYDCRNELTDYKGRISRLELERLRLERENEQLRTKLNQSHDWIPEGRPYHRRNQSEAVARSLVQSEAPTRSYGQSEHRPAPTHSDHRNFNQSDSRKLTRSFTCHPMSQDQDVITHREPIRSQITNRRLSMPTRPNQNGDDQNHVSTNHNQLHVPPIAHQKVTPTNIAPPTDDTIVNAPTAKQRRARAAFGKSPKRSLSEEFRQKSMSIDKGDEDTFDTVSRRPRPKLEKTPRYDETNLDESREESNESPSNERVLGRTDLAELERQLDSLSMDKRTVETALSHIPIRGSRQDRIDKEHLDQRLDEINASLGAVRMQLKKCHVLKTSR